jgi:hypothetical protein
MDPFRASNVDGNETKTAVIWLVLTSRPRLAKKSTIHLLGSFIEDTKEGNET